MALVDTVDEFKRVALLRWIFPWKEEIIHTRRRKAVTSRYTRRVLKQWDQREKVTSRESSTLPE
jgi:hypothetical protein